ncbi:hypothetical protein OBV_26350 [Oscillibacter valericigenes Sjm18-20]|nr:hypothetical protein OBV_26350 [Oscillibacter valericigenes Sjm18-20]
MRAILGGVPMQELPPRTLKALAAVVGNSGMLSLAEISRSRVELAEFSSPGDDGPETAFEVPDSVCLLAAPASLPTQAAPESGCDPAVLGAWGESQ